MRKLRSDSPWAKLTEEQRATLGAWLLDENLPYREALERSEKEYGVKASLSSVVRLYQQLAEERLHRELLGLQSTANKIENRSLEWDDLTRTARTLVANRLIQLAVGRPERVRDLATLSRILVSNDIAMVKRRWLELEEEKREYAERKEIHRQAYREAVRIHADSAKGHDQTSSAPNPNSDNETPLEPPITAYSPS